MPTKKENNKPQTLPVIEEGKVRLNEAQLGSDSKVIKWLQKKSMVLEKEQVEIDPQFEPLKDEALKWFADTQTEVLMPLTVEEKGVLGVVGLGKKENLAAYTLIDINLLKNIGQQAGIAIYNAMHHEDLVRKGLIEQEMKFGREIQMKLIPHKDPQVQNLLVSGMIEPAEEIGGDYFDYITSQEGQVDIVIGDVSGKGVPAGLMMVMAKAILHGFSKRRESASPKTILKLLNGILYEQIKGEKFMTMLYLKWFADERKFIYSSAGHEHIIWYKKKSNSVELIQSGGFMLGMMPKTEDFLEERELKMDVGDKMILYTDGATEAESPTGGRYGLNRLEDFVRKQAPNNNSVELKKLIYEDLRSYIGIHAQYDDITLIVAEVI